MVTPADDYTTRELNAIQNCAYQTPEHCGVSWSRRCSVAFLNW